ncbi:phage tail tip lysozyme [Ancylobacter rudongensis]|uniref:phage tail tip lysozyme n=1 Tax=Ancylobacter rudongensis TaxID=177413 RepID=UPI0013BE9C1B|nr:phage tail tip lysozyme [Ancylobacter rudongensis]
MRVNAEMERLTFQMRGMSDAADPIKDAADSVAYLREQAKQMPFSLKTITNGFVKLKATGTDPLDGSLKAIADGVAAFGGSDDAFNRIVLGISQMSGKGVIQMEEMRQQLAESMPRAMELMARSMGVSMGDLVTAIGSGTVAAKPALEAFYAEIERTFGGRAKAMMMTFDGQISQMKTSLQNLATGEGGGAFFAQVKNQLVDLNDFLAGPVARTLATDMGNALGRMIAGLRETIDFVVTFRGEIGRTAQVLAAGFGIMAATRALGSLRLALQGNIADLRMFATNWRSAAADIALGASGLRNMSTASTGVGVALMGARGAMAALLTGAGAIMPWITALGLAVYGASEYFGLMSNKVDDAYESLKKYGAESRRQAETAVSDKRKEIEDRIGGLQSRLRDTNDPNSGLLRRYSPVTVAKMRAEVAQLLADARQELYELERSAPDLIGDAVERQDATALRQLQRRADERQAEISREYDERGKALQEEMLRERELAVKNGTAIVEVERENTSKILENRLDRNSKIREFIAQETAYAKREMETGDVDRQRQMQKWVNQLAQMDTTAIAERNEILSTKLGIQHLDKLPSEEKSIDRGRKQLGSLTQEVAGLEAKLKGTSSTFAELQARISRGDFGTIKEGGEAVRQMHEEMLSLARQSDILNKLAKGQSKADNDVQSARMKLLEEEMELREKLAGRDLTEGERIQLRLDNGYYEGLGPTDKIQQALSEVITSFTAQGELANRVGEVIRSNTFGQQTVQRVDTVTAALARMTAELGNIQSGLLGANFSQLGRGLSTDLMTAMQGGMTPAIDSLSQEVVTRMQVAMQHLQAKGWSRTVASGIVGNLVAESGMNPNAIGDNGNAFGLAQWNDRADEMKAFLTAQGKQWNDFLGQLDFVDYELRNKERKAAAVAGLSANPAQAANAIMDHYERPADWAKMESMGRRQSAAQRAYDMAGSAVPTFNAAEVPGLRTYNELLENRKKATEGIRKAAEELTQQERNTNEPLRYQEARVEFLKETQAQIENVGQDADELGRNFARLQKQVSAGKFGKSTDINADEYKDIVAAVKELDAVEKTRAETKRAQSASEEQLKKLEEQRLDINRQLAEAQKQAQNPDYQGDTDQYRRLNQELESYLDNVKHVYGQDSAAYRQAMQVKQGMLSGQLQLETTQTLAAYNLRTREFQDSLLTQTQLRQVQMERDFALIDQWAERMRRAGMSEVDIVREVEAQKGSIRAQYAAQANPLQRQMREWSDIQGQLAQQSTQWMDNLAGGVSGLIMGTGDLRTAINGIIQDLLNVSLKGMLSSVVGKGGSGKLLNLFEEGGYTGDGNRSAPAGVVHRGEYVMPKKVVERIGLKNLEAMHMGALRGYASGGLVTSVPAPRTSSLAARPTAMPALVPGASGGMTINAPITVNGSAGTPEQNNDLAKKMAKQMENTMRGVVVDEIRKQQRPGNLFNNRGL